jgi:hypothetical protein
MVEDGNDIRTKGNEREPLWGEKRKVSSSGVGGLKACVTVCGLTVLNKN